MPAIGCGRRCIAVFGHAVMPRVLLLSSLYMLALALLALPYGLAA